MLSVLHPQGARTQGRGWRRLVGGKRTTLGSWMGWAGPPGEEPVAVPSWFPVEHPGLASSPLCHQPGFLRPGGSRIFLAGKVRTSQNRGSPMLPAGGASIHTVGGHPGEPGPAPW